MKPHVRLAKALEIALKVAREQVVRGPDLSQGGRVYYFPKMSYVGMYLSAAAFLATLRDQADMESFSAVADFMFPTVEFWRVALRLEGYVVP